MIETVGYMFWNHPEWLKEPVRGHTPNPDWMEAGTEVIPLVRLTDHQAAMREAWELLGRWHGWNKWGGDDKELERDTDAFLSAHQEFGGGGE